MQQLVIDLLSISRVESDRFRRPTTPVDLAAIVRTTVAQLRDSERGRAGDIVAKLGDAAQPMLGDAAQLGQLAHHIASHAMKYSRAGTPVTVQLTREGNRVRLSASDQGHGLASAHITPTPERISLTDPASRPPAGRVANPTT